MNHVPSSMWRPARVVENRQVSNGSMWLTLESQDAFPAAYEPGHVLGLGLDLEQGFIRHAYTVSRGEPLLRRFSHLYRVITGGRMTNHLVKLSTGDTLYFHGPFHTPIQQEVQSSAECIALIGTGAGIGPLFGYAEKTLREGEKRSLTLYAGFHEASHICMIPELEALSQTYANFTSEMSLTHPPHGWNGLVGRVTESVPERFGPGNLQSYHFHLVGNGDMVHLMRRALLRAGVSMGRVSIETYFNHHSEPPKDRIEEVANRFLAKPSSNPQDGFTKSIFQMK